MYRGLSVAFSSKLQPHTPRLAESRTRMVTTRRAAFPRQADTRLDGNSGAAVDIGGELRAARERLGWPLADCAAGLRIRLPYLEALEDGRAEAFPGKAYALAFLRSYARGLGLDADALCARFKADTGNVAARTRLTFPVPMAERGLPGGAVLLLALVMVVGTYAAWYRLSGEGRLPAEVPPAIPARLAPLAEQAVPMQAAAQPTPPPETNLAAEEEAGPEMPSVSPTSAAAAMPLPPVPTLAPPAAGLALTTTGPAAQADAPRLLLRARADAWVQVRERNGQVVLNRVLHPGDSWPVPARTGLLLTTGNAPGTDVVLDGVQVVSLAGFGAVRRDLPLEPDAVRDGRLSAAAPHSPN